MWVNLNVQSARTSSFKVFCCAGLIIMCHIQVARVDQTHTQRCGIEGGEDEEEEEEEEEKRRRRMHQRG